MDKLWTEKARYINFNFQKHHIHMTCGRFLDFIPYERNYKNLTDNQLLSLIQDAKIYKWQALDLTDCGLSKLPNALWDLPDLKMLYLGNNTLFSIRSRMRGDENTFSTIPTQIEQLTNLQVLSLRGNPATIESSIGLKFPRLYHLELYGCNFLQLPDAYIINSLRELAIDCKGEHLSDNILKLKNLCRAYFGSSNFVDLPLHINELQHLQELYLFNTQLTSLPESILKLPVLSRLVIDDTPLAKTLPPEILKQSAKEIVRYVVSQNSNAPKEYFNEAKMVIVGQGHVGKSSLINRLVNNKFEETVSTEGIDISSWFFSKKNATYKLNIWDFGGQEIYHSTHQFFLTERSLYLLVWDALAEDEYGRIAYWLKTIQSFANDSPIIIVVNKCDRDNGRIRRIDENEYKEHFPQIKKIFYISCKDNLGIKELRHYIKSIAIKLPLMKTSWLSSWLSVRKKLEEMSKHLNFIPYTEYLDICKNNNIGYEEARSLIKYLHDLGIVLYYYNDPLLKHLVILSAEWGTDAVYKILDEQEHQLKGRNGLLHLDDLSSIWTDKDRYPQERYPYLLNLMKKFQLAFEISSSVYLVTELLDTKSIILKWDFPYQETLSFRYVYDFLPAGVMTRFIVSINNYLETIQGIKQCWKKGAYLRYQNAYALVRLYDNPTARYIEIKVSGKNIRYKKELLTLIRTKFYEIHNQFNQVKIVEQIPCICSEDCDFLFDYNKLLNAELKGKRTIECHTSLDDVDIKKLLDGVETPMDYNMKYTTIIAPQFNPQISQQVNPEITTNATTSLSANVTNTVTIEIKDLINSLYGDFNDLKDEVGEEFEEFNVHFEKIQKALDTLTQSNTKEDIVKSGAMKKIERFLNECSDSHSKTGKILAGIKYSSKIITDLAKKYNKLAKYLALPNIPFVDGV